jgi:putative copper export protein
VLADPLALIRAAHFAATLLASGTVFFAAFVIGPTRLPQTFPILRMHMNLLIWTALVASVLTGAMWLIWLAANILGESLAEVCLHGGVWSVLADTRFGSICGLRLVLAVFLGLLVLDPAQRVCGAMSMSFPTHYICSRQVPGLEGCRHSRCCFGLPAEDKSWVGMISPLR